MSNIKSGSIIPWQTVYTGFQKAGKGQRGNTWNSERDKNLLFSCYLPIRVVAVKQFYLTAKIAISLHKMISNLIDTQKNVLIKWPNDILINDKKLAGILIETIVKGKYIDGFVAGIGLNVNQNENLHPKATSLKLFTRKEFEIPQLAEKLLYCLHSEFLNLDFDKKYYLENLYGYKNSLKFRDSSEEFVGEILDVNFHGKLVVDKKGILKEYDLKEIEFIFNRKNM